MTEEDILWTLEQTNIMKIVDGIASICTDENLLSEIYKKGGRLGKPVIKELIHWIPFRIKWEGYPVNY